MVPNTFIFSIHYNWELLNWGTFRRWRNVGIHFLRLQVESTTSPTIGISNILLIEIFRRPLPDARTMDPLISNGILLIMKFIYEFFSLFFNFHKSIDNMCFLVLMYCVIRFECIVINTSFDNIYLCCRTRKIKINFVIFIWYRIKYYSKN